MNAKQVGVLKESSWNFQQVGVLRVDASSSTEMLRQMCEELVTSDIGAIVWFPHI